MYAFTRENDDFDKHGNVFDIYKYINWICKTHSHVTCEKHKQPVIRSLVLLFFFFLNGKEFGFTQPTLSGVPLKITSSWMIIGYKWENNVHVVNDMSGRPQKICLYPKWDMWCKATHASVKLSALVFSVKTFVENQEPPIPDMLNMSFW